MEPPPPVPPESLSGLIERVTFFNEENGFSVLKVRVKGRREEVTVVGSLPSANAGEWVTAQGRWVQDREFGLQFRAELLASAAPTSREGLEKYLGSGLVKGIGPVYAQKLIAKFGERIFEIIENHSVRLEEVEGIGPKRRREIKGAWAEQKIIRDIMLFLHSNGVSTSRAVRVYKTYGDDAVDRVRANPYGLARDIPGIGFKTADLIAQKLGIPHDSILRAVAGIEHVLLEATGQGHCALPRGLLKEEAAKLLLVEETVSDTGLERARLNRLLVRETIGGEDLVFLPALKRAEETIAERIRQLRASPAVYPAIDIRQGAGVVPAENRQRTCAQPAGRLAAGPHGPDAHPHGRARRGEDDPRQRHPHDSARQEGALPALRARPAAPPSASPSPPAWKPRPSIACSRWTPRAFRRNESNPLPCDLLVVDETSMVDVPLMSALLRALPSDAALLLVGDVDQLPSVGPGMVLRHLIESGVCPVVRLTEVFRQAAQSRIITNAHRINDGLLPQAQEGDSDFFFIEREEPERIAQTLVEVVRRRIPDKFELDPIRDVQVLSPMNRGSLGVRELNTRLQAELNPPRPEEPCIEKISACNSVSATRSSK